MLTGFTILWLCVYFPVETYASVAGEGVVSFGYLIDLVGLALMVAGVAATRRRLVAGPGLLVGGWAWTSANFWRASMERFWAAAQGRPLQFGPVELWLGPALTLVAIVGLCASLASLTRQSSPR